MVRFRSLDVSRPSGKGDGFIKVAIPNYMNAGSPHWHPTIQELPECQNVAGLWLKYGV
jgi:hypothetical protein